MNNIIDQNVNTYWTSFHDRMKFRQSFSFRKEIIGIPSTVYIPIVIFGLGTALYVNVFFGLFLLVFLSFVFYFAYSRDDDYLDIASNSVRYKTIHEGYRASDSLSPHFINID